MSQVDRVHAANEMYRILSTSGERTHKEIAKVADFGADAAKNALSDSTFSQAVYEASHMRVTYADELEDILGLSDQSRTRFADFLKQERSVLLTAGLEQDLIEESLAQGSEIAERAREWRGDAEFVFRQVEQLQISTQRLSQQLKEVQEIENALRRASEHSRLLIESFEQAQFDHQPNMHELAARHQESRDLAGYITNARQTNNELAAQLTYTTQPELRHPRGTQRRTAHIGWDLTFGVVGMVMCVANVTIVPVLKPPLAALSGVYGGILTDRATNKLMDRWFGER